MAVVRVIETRRRTRRVRKRPVIRCARVRRQPVYRCDKSLSGGFLPMLIPLIAAAIGAAPAIAGTVIAAKNAKR